jgi:hypothetical protein
MTRDDGYTPFAGRRQGPPTLTLVTRLWRRRRRKPAPGSCARCISILHGIEARCTRGHEDDLLMSQVERTPEAAKARADEWLAAAVSRGFEVVDCDDI